MQGPGTRGRSVAELWLETLEDLSRRAAHALKGALNAATVNLEVIRSGAARGAGADDGGAAHERFATAAADSMEGAVRMIEALVALTRDPPADPASRSTDVMAEALRIHALAEPPVRERGGALDLVAEPGPPAMTAADIRVVRLAIAASIHVALESQDRLRCSVTPGGAGKAVAIRVVPAGASRLDAERLAALAAAGIGWENDGHGIFIVFPPQFAPNLEES